LHKVCFVCVCCESAMVLGNNIFVGPRLQLYARLKYVDVSIFLNNKYYAIGTLRKCNLLRGHERKYFFPECCGRYASSTLQIIYNIWIGTHSELIYFSFFSHITKRFLCKKKNTQMPRRKVPIKIYPYIIWYL